jgi:drug/metabolite transporter (DMT)-like permease
MTEGRKTELDAVAVLLLVTCCALWGVNQAATKFGLAEVPPLLQAAFRSVVAALLLLLWSRLRGLKVLGADGTGRAGVLAGLLFAAEFACIFLGLQFTSASRMAVFLYVSPFVVALGMPFIAKSEKLSATQAAGLLLAFAGVVWAFAEGFSTSGTSATSATQRHAGPMQWWGDALGLGAAALWGLTTLVLRGSRLSSALPEKTLLYQLVVSGAALLLAGLLKGEVWPAQISAPVWASLFFQTVVVTFVSYLVWFWLIRHYPATRIAAFTLLTPVFGLLAGVLLLKEPLTLRLIVALVAVCAGIWLVSRPTAQPSLPPPPPPRAPSPQARLRPKP